MHIREYPLEPALIPIREDLLSQGYEVDAYQGQRQLCQDGLRIVKSGQFSAAPNMIGSTWLCGVILGDKAAGLTLRLREGTPYSAELFNVLKQRFRY